MTISFSLAIMTYYAIKNVLGKMHFTDTESVFIIFIMFTVLLAIAQILRTKKLNSIKTKKK